MAAGGIARSVSWYMQTISGIRAVSWRIDLTTASTGNTLVGDVIVWIIAETEAAAGEEVMTDLQV
jgi:hypothetical protein